FDRCWIWKQGGVVDLDDVAALQLDPVLDRRRCGDELELELAFEPLLDDLEVKQAKEAASKAESQRRRVLRLERQRAVVQLQLLQRLLEVGELVGVGRKKAGENHRLDLAIAGQRARRSTFGRGDGVSDPGVDDV